MLSYSSESALYCLVDALTLGALGGGWRRQTGSEVAKRPHTQNENFITKSVCRTVLSHVEAISRRKESKDIWCCLKRSKFEKLQPQCGQLEKSLCLRYWKGTLFFLLREAPATRAYVLEKEYILKIDNIERKMTTAKKAASAVMRVGWRRMVRN